MATNYQRILSLALTDERFQLCPYAYLEHICDEAAKCFDDLPDDEALTQALIHYIPENETLARAVAAKAILQDRFGAWRVERLVEAAWTAEIAYLPENEQLDALFNALQSATN